MIPRSSSEDLKAAPLEHSVFVIWPCEMLWVINKLVIFLLVKVFEHLVDSPLLWIHLLPPFFSFYLFHSGVISDCALRNLLIFVWRQSSYLKIVQKPESDFGVLFVIKLLSDVFADEIIDELRPSRMSSLEIRGIINVSFKNKNCSAFVFNQMVDICLGVDFG